MIIGHPFLLALQSNYGGGRYGFAAWVFEDFVEVKYEKLTAKNVKAHIFSAACYHFETWNIIDSQLIDAKNAENPPTTKLMLCAIESGECLKNNETMIVLKTFFLKKKSRHWREHWLRHNLLTLLLYRKKNHLQLICSNHQDTLGLFKVCFFWTSHLQKENFY